MLDRLSHELQVDVSAVGDASRIVGAIDERNDLQVEHECHGSKHEEQHTRLKVISRSRLRNCSRSRRGTGTDSSPTTMGSSKVGKSFKLIVFSLASSNVSLNKERRRKRTERNLAFTEGIEIGEQLLQHALQLRLGPIIPKKVRLKLK